MSNAGGCTAPPISTIVNKATGGIILGEDMADKEDRGTFLIAQIGELRTQRNSALDELVTTKAILSRREVYLAKVESDVEELNLIIEDLRDQLDECRKGKQDR